MAERRTAPVGERLWGRAASALGILVVVVACSSAEPPRADKPPVDSPRPSASQEAFALALQARYLALATEAFDRGAYADAEFFATRAKAIDTVAPPRLAPAPFEIVDEEGRLSPVSADARAAATMRARLAAVLDNGATNARPRLAAEAQAHFDCWSRAVDGRGPTDVARRCREGAERAYAQLSRLMADQPTATAAAPQRQAAPQPTPAAPAPPPSETAAPAVAAAPVPVAQILQTRPAALSQIAEAARPSTGDFVVFFERGSATLTLEAESNLRIAISHIAHRGVFAVTLFGFSDTLGDSSVNRRLSLRRAQAVRRFLKQRLGEDLAVDIQAFGEAHTPIDTGDGVEEALNRRVEIRLDG